MANEDIIFRAGFEYDEVIAGLAQIGNHAEQAAASSSASLAQLGQVAQRVVGHWGEQYESVSRQILINRLLAAEGKEFSDEETAQHEKLLKKEKAYVEAIEQTRVALAKRVAAAARAPDTPMQNIRTPAGSVSLGSQLGAGTLASRGQLSVLGDTGAAKADLERLGDVIDEMFNRGEIRAKQFAGVFHTIATSLAGELKGQDLSNALKPLENQARRILAMFKSGDLDFSKETNIETMIAQMNELRAVASEFLGSSSAEAQEFGAQLLAKLDQADDAFTNVHGSADVLRKDMKAITLGMKQAVGASDELEEQMGAIGKLPLDLQKKLKIKQVEIEAKQLEKVIKQLGKSTSTEANKAGKEFEEMGEEIKKAYKNEEIGADEAVKGLREVATAAKKTGNIFDESFGKAKRAITNTGPPIWKLGTAMDRIGVRGAGGILRVVDAVKEMGPAFIAAGVAAAGVAIIITKLISLAVELGKKAAAAFLEFTKGAIETSKQIQHLDAQFQGLLSGNASLGKSLRNLVLEESFEFGVSLTGDFANILVPLADSTEEIRRMAEDVAAISHLRGIAVENIVNAVKQATGGHFRPFQQTLGMTPQEVDRVQELQEAYGQLTGTLIGLEEFMTRRGISFDAISNSLAVAQGKLSVFRTEIEVAFGQPIRNELGEQLGRLVSYVEENREALLNFFEEIGSKVAELIASIGGLVGDWLDAITPEDIASVERSVEDLTDSLLNLIETITGIGQDDFNPMIDGLNGVLGVATNLADTLADIASFWDFLKTIDNPFRGAEEKRAATKRQNELDDLAERKDVSKELRAAMEELIYLQEELSTSHISWRDAERLLDLQKQIELLEEIDAKQKAAGTFIPSMDVPGQLHYFDTDRYRARKDKSEEEITRQLRLSNNEIEIGVLEDAIAEAEEKIGPAKIGIEFDQKAAKILVDEEDKFLAKEVAFSIKRRDAGVKYLNALRDQRIKSARESNEALESFGEKEIDIFTKYRDKEEDVEEDRVKKRIKLEEKLQEKLRDIRAKFNFDAAEAIRMNDAVALLRIRRRMAFELAQAKLKNKEDIDDNDDTAEEKRKDNLKWLNRQIRDNNEAERRKLLDIQQAHGQKMDDLDQNYNDELHLLALHEQDKEDAIAEWRRQADRDLQTWHDNRMEMQRNQYKDLIADVRKYERMIREIRLENMYLANKMQYDPVAWGQSSTNLYVPPTSENYGGYIPNTQVSSPGTRPATQPQQPQQYSQYQPYTSGQAQQSSAQPYQLEYDPPNMPWSYNPFNSDSFNVSRYGEEWPIKELEELTEAQIRFLDEMGVSTDDLQRMLDRQLMSGNKITKDFYLKLLDRLDTLYETYRAENWDRYKSTQAVREQQQEQIGAPQTHYPVQQYVPQGQPIDQEMEELRALAIQLATKGGFDGLVNNMQKTTNLASIRATLTWLRQQGLAGGGIAPAGRTALVGEKGPEPIMPMSAGIIAPHAPLNYSPGISDGGQTINDNSMNVDADLSMLDPSQVSPMQRTIIHSIVTDEILKLGVG